MTDRARARRAAIRANEEADAADAEALDNDQAVISVRVPAALADTLKARAADEHLPTSALVRRTLTRALRGGAEPVLTVEQVEEIARRVIRETA